MIIGIVIGISALSIVLTWITAPLGDPETGAGRRERR